MGVNRVVHGEHGGGYFGAEGAHGDLGRPVLPTGESDLAAVCMGAGGGNLCRRQDIIWQNNPFSTYVNPNSMFLQMGRLSEHQFQILAHSPIRLYALVRLS